MIGRIIFGDNVSETCVNAGTLYFDESVLGAQYLNTIYLRDFEFERSTWQITTTESPDETGTNRIITRNSIERVSIRQLVNANLLDLLNSIDNCDFKRLEIFEDVSDPTATETYRIERVRLEDNADVQRTTGQVILSFDLIPTFANRCCDAELDVLSEKLAFWDNNNDGTADIDGNALFLGGFSSWQLYFESDGVTPLASGDVELFVQGTDLSGITYNLGTFNGGFGDNLNDSSKWSSFYGIWNYFGISNTIGHTNKVDFDKAGFGSDFNFIGNEILDNALEIKFFLSVDSGNAQPTTLYRIYSTLSSFLFVTGDNTDGIETAGVLNQSFERMELDTYREETTDVSGGGAGLHTSFALKSTDSLKFTYEIDRPVTGTALLYQDRQTITATTVAGLDATLEKGFKKSFPASPVLQDVGIIPNPNLGLVQVQGALSDVLTRSVTIKYTVLNGTMPDYGTVNATGKWFVNGVLQASVLDTSTGNHSLALPVLPNNTTPNTIRLESETTEGFDIVNEFQIQFRARY